jgi:hypothetical protein
MISSLSPSSPFLNFSLSFSNHSPPLSPLLPPLLPPPFSPLTTTLYSPPSYPHLASACLSLHHKPPTSLYCRRAVQQYNSSSSSSTVAQQQEHSTSVHREVCACDFFEHLTTLLTLSSSPSSLLPCPHTLADDRRSSVPWGEDLLPPSLPPRPSKDR